MTVVHETGNHVPPVSSGVPNGIWKMSQTGGKQPFRAQLEPAVSEQLSITRVKVCDPAAMLRSVEEIPSAAHQPEQTFSFYS